MPERRFERLICRCRVRAGLAALILTLVFAAPNTRSLLAFVVIGLSGLLIRAWASGYLKKDKELATSGPYGLTRNPLYLGNFLLGIGLAIGAWSWPALAVFAAYFLVFYSVTIAKERRRMKELFPDGYADYRRRVPLFFPALRRPGPSLVAFSWGLYLRNKEYRALAGTAAVGLLLLAKMVLLR
jgi:protein-S-isoprenylcysteine O-methyltransferase Ste14